MSARSRWGAGQVVTVGNKDRPATWAHASDVPGVDFRRGRQRAPRRHQMTGRRPSRARAGRFCRRALHRDRNAAWEAGRHTAVGPHRHVDGDQYLPHRMRPHRRSLGTSRCRKPHPAADRSGACPPGTLERDDFSSNRHRALTLLLEHDLFRKPVPTFRDHALGPAPAAPQALAGE
jgi:hypothetical protein